MIGVFGVRLWFRSLLIRNVFGINILVKFVLLSCCLVNEFMVANLLKNVFWMDNELRLFGEQFEYRPLELNWLFTVFVKLFRFAVVKLFAFKSVVIWFELPFRFCCKAFDIVDEQCENCSADGFSVLGFRMPFNEFVNLFLELFNELGGLLLVLSGLLCWVSLCLRKSTFLWNALPHVWQAKGLYPVCFLEWVIRFEDWLNALPQTEHLCGFSPV